MFSLIRLLDSTVCTHTHSPSLIHYLVNAPLMAGAKPSETQRARRRRRLRQRHFRLPRPLRRPFATLRLLYRRRRSRRRRTERPPYRSPCASTSANASSAAEAEAEADEDEREHEFEEVYELPDGNPTAEDLMNGIRLRYVQGLQLMVQLQCDALVNRCGASPLIYGVVGGMWMRFIAASRIFDSTWAAEVEKWARAREHDVEVNTSEGESSFQSYQSRNCRKRSNSIRKNHELIWLRSLRREVPLHSSLAISFLTCHITRQPILPNDIVRWASELELPYILAFHDIEKLLGKPSSFCPLSSKMLFRPIIVIGAWKLESVAGRIARKIGLHLPPVNFYAIAYRFLENLSLPVENILHSACRVYEWSLPVELCLSANRCSLPTRVHVMAILVVTLRVLYNINGQGVWEKSLYSDVNSSASRKCSLPRQSGNINPIDQEDHTSMNLDDTCQLNDEAGNRQVNGSGASESANRKGLSVEDAGFCTSELLCNLKTVYDKLNDKYEYFKDFTTYLKYCKDVFSSGGTRPFKEALLMEKFRNTYGKKVDKNAAKDKSGSNEHHGKRSRDATVEEHANNDGNASVVPVQSESGHDLINPVDASIRWCKSDMEKNGFSYIPPKAREVPENGYLRYRRKRLWGKLFYVAHADYYILLRACAKVAEVDCRILHLGVLCLEKRLNWIEERIRKSLASLHDNTLKDIIDGNSEEFGSADSRR